MSELALMALLGAGAFWDGLYSPGQQLILTAGLALLILVRGRSAAGSRLQAAGSHQDEAAGSRLEEAVALALLAVGVASSLAAPAAASMAAHGPLLAAGWFLAWVAGRQLSGDDRACRLLGRTFAMLGTVMTFGGVALMSYLPAHHTGRLAAFLGYPIAVGVLGLLGLAGSLPWLVEQRWWVPALVFGNGAAILLSGSRGVWAVGVLLAAYLTWAAPQLLRKVGAGLAAAFAAALWAGPAIAGRQVGPALAVLLTGCLTVLLLHWFPLGRRRRWLWFGAAAAWVLALACAPGWPWFLGRATALPLTEGSSVERLAFIRDGLRISLSRPLGAGYRAWTALHLQGAGYAYYSAEVHSAPLDLAIGFGWAAAAGFLLLLGRFLAGLRHGRAWSPERLAVLAGLAALGVHSLADWDLSYGLFAVPLWLGFGLMAPAPARAKDWRLPFGLTTAVAGLALAGTVVLGAGDIFEGLAEQALAAGRPEVAYRHAAMATAVSPWNDMAHAMAGQALRRLGRRAEALSEFGRARSLGPYEPWYAELAAATFWEDGRPREAAAAYRDYVRLWPWQVPAYEEALSANLDMLLRASVVGDRPLQADLLENGRAILAALDAQKAKEPRATPRAPMQVDKPVIREARDRFGR
ncbi:MAG TPA: bacterial transcriptional activator domain-containing protein [Symbiobacteriaceae bacterium]|jgi:tetratricopeptide (TPR) repeat protein